MDNHPARAYYSVMMTQTETRKEKKMAKRQKTMTPAEQARETAIQAQILWAEIAVRAPQTIPTLLEDAQGEAIAEDVDRMQGRIARLIESLEYQVGAYRREANEWMAKVADRHANKGDGALAYELSWASGVFENAARLEVYGAILTQVRDHGPEHVMDHVVRKVMESTTDGHSSSATANLMSAERGAAYSRFYRDFNRYFAGLGFGVTGRF